MPALTPTGASTRERILHDGLGGLCLRLAAPAVAVTVLHGANLLVDMVWAGHLLGTESVAALSVVYSLNHLVFSVEALVAVGTAMVLSQALGADSPRDASQVYRAASLLCLLFGASLIGLGYAWAPDLLGVMGLHGRTLTLGWEYFGLYLLGMPLGLYAFVSSGLLQGHGAIGRMTVVWVLAIALNAALTPVLIEAGFGIRGAALGTMAGQWLICVGNWHFLRRQPGFTLKPLGVGRLVLRRVLAIGQSGFTMQLVYFVQAFLVFSTVARYGDVTDIAIMGATYRLVLLGVYLATGFSRALQPVLGMSVGAGQWRRVRKAFGVFNLGALLTVLAYWLPLMLAPAFAFHLIVPGLDVTATQLGEARVYFAIMPLFPFLLTSLVLLQAVGLARWVTWLGVIRLLLLFVPAIYVLPRVLGLPGVYWALAWMDAALFVLVLGLVLRRLWRIVRAPSVEAVPENA
ncbi:MAG TPA: MATE family efflux transporter [Rhodanobacteraceae bacterium]|nr:MATE family efflux transporter [Rhodanobacteraceae bacterium]